MSSNPTSTTSTARASRNPLHTRRGRAGLAGTAVLLAALPLLAACSAGNNPEVYNIVPDNGEGTSGYMYISNVWVVFDQTTGNAEVIGSVANTDPNRGDSNQLTGVTLDGTPTTIAAPADTTKLLPGVTVAGGQVTIPGMQAVHFGQPGQPEIEAAGADLTVGNNAKVTYTFSTGSSVTITAIVEPNSGLWAQYNPNGANTASPSPSAIATGTSTATAGASVAPTLGNSASPQNTVATSTATPLAPQTTPTGTVSPSASPTQ